MNIIYIHNLKTQKHNLKSTDHDLLNVIKFNADKIIS